MRATLIGALCILSGCGATIQPGHRGIIFDPRHGGLQHDVLGPGWWRLGPRARVDDFDVTYSTKHETMHTISARVSASTCRWR